MRPTCRLTALATLVLGMILPSGVLPAAAQGTWDGSLYSRFGIGELQYFSNAQDAAFGYSGWALHSLSYLNLNNPGTWADQTLTRASAGFTHQNLRISDANQSRSRLSSGHLDGLHFGFPIFERKLGVALGFAPYSRVSYSVVREDSTPLVPGPNPNLREPDQVATRIEYFGSGGLQQIVGGFGLRLHHNLSVGVRLNTLFGIIDEGRRTSFIESVEGAQFRDTNLETSTRMNGLSASFGLLFILRNVLAQNDFVDLGAAFTLPTHLTARRVTTLGMDLSRDSLGTAIPGTVDLPWQLGAGIAYYPNAQWTISTGFRLAPWSEFQSSLRFPGYEPGNPEALADALQWGVGFEFLPAGSDLLAPYLARVGYRLGFSYDEAYISPDRGANLNTGIVTAGLSLPTLIPGTHLDIQLQAGRRGDARVGLVRDLFYRLSVSVNVGERWFQTPQLR